MDIVEALLTLNLILELLSILPALRIDATAVARELASTDDGETKLKNTIDNVEKLLADLRAAMK